MLLLKANADLKEIFTRLINTMDVSVIWNQVFVISNNNLILAGERRSLIFSYEDKRAYSDILDFTPGDKEIEQMPEDPLLTNLFNMTLYAFGKWGSIKKVKVEKDYAELNRLFQNVLNEIKVESSFRDDNFRFYQDGILISYEDIIDAALKVVRETEPQTEGEHELGLWHNVIWKVETYPFEKQRKNEGDAIKSRIGNNFYLVDYICPFCREKVYMTVFPKEEDVLIETEEGRIFLARAYTCNVCNSFYTPKPEKLLGEGEVYSLEFEDDRIAYEDYFERLGKQGTRDSSLRLNEYETKRKAGEKTEENADNGSNEQNTNSDWLGKGNESDMSHIPVKEEGAKNHSVEDVGSDGSNERTSPKKKFVEPETIIHKKYDFSAKTIDELKAVIAQIERDRTDVAKEKHGGKGTSERYDPQYVEAAKLQLKEKLKAKYDARLKITGRMSDRQRIDLKKQIQNEKEFSESDAQVYMEQIDEILYKNEKKKINKKVEAAINKSYGEITRMIIDIEHGEGAEELRKDALEKLKIIKAERGKQEVKHLIKGMPLQMDGKQYEEYLEKIKQYGDIGIEQYEKKLEQKRNMEEKEEIERLMIRIDKKGRKELNDLYEQLKKQDYKSQNVMPYLDKIHEKMYEMDKASIDKICRNMIRVSFEEGLATYNKINESMFLPELKKNALEMIHRRLTKIKTDENKQLVRKLKKDMQKKMQDFSRIHFYSIENSNMAEQNLREQTSGDFTPQVSDEQKEKVSETVVIYRALNRYAANRNEFEFPLMICDSSRRGKGKKGFVLTPEHIFWRDFLESGKINIMDIEGIEYKGKKIIKEIYMKRFAGEAKKLPNVIRQNEKEVFAKILNEFIIYLQEKPESRNIDYLVEGEHVVKCCYRCGYTYKGGNVCPKCGNKLND